jgi:hypothetical protein
MKEYICLKCHRVFSTASLNPKCCGELEEFFPEKHGRLLIGSSNAWISVWEKWKSNPLLGDVIAKLSEEGCSCAATSINVLIQDLIDMQD